MYDTVVDGTKLNQSLTASANSLRQKFGYSGQINYDETTGFKNFIDNVPSPTSSNYLQYAINCSKLFYQAQLPEECSISIVNCVQLDNMFFDVNGVSEISLNVKPNVNYNWETCFYSNTLDDELTKVTISPQINASQTYFMFANRSSLQQVVGEIGSTTGTMELYNMFSGCSSLQDVLFKSNCITKVYQDTFKDCVNLSTDSLISLANGLVVASGSAKTIVLSSTSVLNCNNIRGVSTNGYFTYDQSGDITLSQFITQIKKWTITS